MKKMEKFEISDLKSAELRNFKSQVQVPGWWRLRPVRPDVRRFAVNTPNAFQTNGLFYLAQDAYLIHSCCGIC